MTTQHAFSFTGQTAFYRGKVRDNYYIGDDILVMVVSDRISAFDHVFPFQIPHKGAILNQISRYSLESVRDIVPTWLITAPNTAAHVSIGHRCDIYPVEFIVRGYLEGHAYRLYSKGIREICGVPLPDGLQRGQKLPQPIITPSTKSDTKDVDISKKDILAQHIISEKEYAIIEQYIKKLYQRGVEIAQNRGLILVDTKYEFGKNREGEIMLVDEVHTPDSSRYYYQKDYTYRLNNALPQEQLSKEFFREWLLSKGFSGQKNDIVPVVGEDVIMNIAKKYRHLMCTMIENCVYSKEQISMPMRFNDTKTCTYAMLHTNLEHSVETVLKKL